MKNFNSNTENNPTWLTPKWIIDSLGEFTLDPCTPPNMPWQTAKRMVSLPTDGLEENWDGERVWLNPPYGRETFKWLGKLSKTKRGVALIFARTETKGFHREVWGKAHSVFFFEGRLRFYKECGEQGGTANAPSCLVTYSPQDTESIENSGLKGRLVKLGEKDD